VTPRRTGAEGSIAAAVVLTLNQLISALGIARSNADSNPQWCLVRGDVAGGRRHQPRIQGASSGWIAPAGTLRSTSSAVAVAATSAKKQALRKIRVGGSPIDNR